MPRSDSKNGRQGDGGGPNTDAGKAISSQNAAKHYLCSRQLLAPGEQKEEFQTLKDGWFASYDTSSFAAKALVENLAECDWMRRRANFQYDRLLNSLPEDLREWAEDQRQEHLRLTRYKTTWDRAFSRAYREAEQFRRSRRTEDSSTQTIARFFPISQHHRRGWQNSHPSLSRQHRLPARPLQRRSRDAVLPLLGIPRRRSARI
jgi:hypothetical protein